MLPGKELRALRRKRGASQEELAVALNVTRQTVSKWENDQMPVSADKQKELADFLGVENLFADGIAATCVRAVPFSANQKIVVAVIAVLIALSCAVTVTVGCVSIPNYRADEQGATSLYIDTGYFWLALGITVIIIGIEAFAILAYRKENRNNK